MEIEFSQKDAKEIIASGTLEKMVEKKWISKENADRFKEAHNFLDNTAEGVDLLRQINEFKLTEIKKP